jgi:hypothetical protein
MLIFHMLDLSTLYLDNTFLNLLQMIQDPTVWWYPGVNLSLLSRVMSSRLSRGTYNGGLLSTEAGTLARVIADGTITLSGYLGENRLLNVTLVPSLFICLSSIIATCFTYNSLYWLSSTLSCAHVTQHNNLNFLDNQMPNAVCYSFLSLWAFNAWWRYPYYIMNQAAQNCDLSTFYFYNLIS